jgi:hypothetical protein
MANDQTLSGKVPTIGGALEPGQLCGGQMWKHPRTFHVYWVAFLDLDLWALMADPREMGSLATSNPGKIILTKDEAEIYLIRQGFIYLGQLHDLWLAETAARR